MNHPSALRQRPSFTVEQAAGLVGEHWAVPVRPTPLPGERDQNFLLEDPDGGHSVLKIANGNDDRALIEAQNAAMARVAAAATRGDGTAKAQMPIPTTSGSTIIEAEHATGTRWLVRRLTWVDGSPLAEVRYRPRELIADVGRRVAEIDAALDGFEHPATQRTLDWDPLNALGVVRNGVTLIQDAGLRATITSLAEQFELATQPRLAELPGSVIHADANDYNIIVGPADRRTGHRSVAGIIDFGDIIRSCRVGDPAIALAYLLLDAHDPLGTARTMVGAYHRRLALTEAELAVLWDMACMRLCVSACMAARQRTERPDDPYLAISQAAIERALPALATIHSRLAEAHLRSACRLEPVPASPTIVRWLRDNADFARPVIDGSVRPADCVVFDLGVASPLITGDPVGNEEPALTHRLSAYLQQRKSAVGIARWDEARLLNTGDAYAAGSMESESRTVHLGEDLYAGEGAPVQAPFDGTVVAFNDNDAPQDYGPVMILRHELPDDVSFYTLYGHLSRASLVGMFEGREISRGERIGTIGGATENGGWTPHLHFQLIVDLLEMGTDFPGICRAGEREIWKALSPDPDLILQLLPEGATARHETVERVANARAAHIGTGLSLAYRRPVHTVRGWMQYLFDDTGRRFLDAYNNVPHVGHCHPRVVEAGARQMALLNTNTRYINTLLGDYAERLAATMPDPLDVVYLVNSASEANELALRLARTFTGRRDTIVLEHAYHGHTTTLIDISPYKHAGPGGSGAPDWVHVAPIPDTFRGEFRADLPDVGARYADQVGNRIAHLAAQGRPPGVFIAETCPSVAGQILLPEGYLETVYGSIRSAGGVCVADEVQTGYGRIGSHFYAFQAHHVVPDIVVLGKPIGNGHPIGAVVTTREIADAFDNGMEFFSTFGGNTVSCAIGMAVLDVMESEPLMPRAANTGAALLERLHSLASVHPIIGDVRGSGLFLGVELVRDRDSLEPAGDEAAFVCNRMRDRGILIGTDGPWHNVLKIRPPMPFNEQDAGLLVAALEQTLGELL
jgi:4-aminobutyrate aminotransferase-like enzyme/Ser/Thr protein kinase RdoA (MazF antagonist)